MEDINNVDRIELLMVDLMSAINNIEEELYINYYTDNLSEAILDNIRNNAQLLENYYFDVLRKEN